MFLAHFYIYSLISCIFWIAELKSLSLYLETLLSFELLCWMVNLNILKQHDVIIFRSL